MTNSKILKENLRLKEGTFYYELRERNNFDVGLYNHFVYSLIKSFDLLKDEDERRKCSLEMWELFFLISKDFIWHQNKSDIYKIRGVNEEMISEVMNNLYEIGNFISWKKELDLEGYFLDLPGSQQ